MSVTSPFLYLLIAAGIIIISNITKVSSFFNIGDVLKKYFQHIIFDSESAYLNLIKFSLFYIMPLCIANAITLTHEIDVDVSENIIVIVSLLVSVIFSYYSRFIDYEVDKIQDDYRFQLMNLILKNTTVVIRYEVVLSIFIILLCFLYSTLAVNLYLIFVLSDLIYAALIQLLMNLLLIIKREDKL